MGPDASAGECWFCGAAAAAEEAAQRHVAAKAGESIIITVPRCRACRSRQRWSRRSFLLVIFPMWIVGCALVMEIVTPARTSEFKLVGLVMALPAMAGAWLVARIVRLGSRSVDHGLDHPSVSAKREEGHSISTMDP